MRLIVIFVYSCTFCEPVSQTKFNARVGALVNGYRCKSVNFVSLCRTVFLSLCARCVFCVLMGEMVGEVKALFLYMNQVCFIMRVRSDLRVMYNSLRTRMWRM